MCIRDRAQVESAQGEFAVKGTAQDYQFQLAAEVHGTDVPKGRWTLNGQGSDQAVREVKLSGQTLEGTIEGNANVAWLPAVRWQAALTGTGLNPVSYTHLDVHKRQLFTLGGGWQQQDGKWLKNYNLNYQYEQFSVGDQPTSSSLLLIPGLNWTWIDADDRLYPTRGLLFGFELRGASTALLLSLIHI